jgi:hypothetical protein
MWIAAAVVAPQATRGFAGSDVHVAVDATTGEARITGGGADEDVAVAWDGVTGAYTITGASGTTIDGAASVSVTGVRSFLVEMGAGDDHVLFDHTPVPRDLRVRLDDGADSLELVGVRVHGRTKLFGGPGADSISASDGCDFRNSLAVRGGDGNDVLTVRDSRFHSYVRLLGGPADDRVTLTRDVLDGGANLAVYGAAGRDWLGISDGTYDQPVSASMGPGRDTVTMSGAEFHDDVDLSGGAQRDVLYFGGGLTWSYAHPPSFRQFE